MASDPSTEAGKPPRSWRSEWLFALVLLAATLAAAYAGTGRFPEAVETAERALGIATTVNNAGMVNLLNAQLRLYRANAPFHQSSN